MTPEIDPSGEFLGSSERVKQLAAQMETIQRNLGKLEANVKAADSVAARTRARIAADQGAGRVSGSTVTGETSPQAQAQVTRNISSETRKATAESERLLQTRKAISRTLQDDLRVMQRYGQYAGGRYLEKQPGGLSSLQRIQLERAQQGRLLGTGPGSRPLLPQLPASTSYTPQSARGYSSSIYDAPERRVIPLGATAGAQPMEKERQSIKEVTQARRDLNQQLLANQTRMRQVSQIEGELATRNAAVARTSRQTSSALSASTNAYAAHSTELRRHGALTTEFISSAARGSATIREMGYQVGSTIGKFGGWLVAGSAVFTALDAIRQLGTGAVQSASGVNQLDRVLQNVDADAATDTFRSQATQFNLPIADVTDANYQMAKVYGDQAEAAHGAEAALYAVKVGELDTATATRYLTAIVNGSKDAHLDLLTVMDQLNQAQNKFGVAIPNTAAGLAKSIGTFTAAGGEYTNLLALITTATKVTGQTGDVVGTAFNRAPGFLRQPTNQAALRGFGIDPTQDIDDVIEQAFKVSKNLGGEKLQQVASAIFGTQYGPRIGTPLLQNYAKYQEVSKAVQPEAAAGSSQRELDKLLASYEERLSRIGTTLQTIGSNLASAGFLDVFGVGLSTLQTMLDVANGLLGVFNDLPAPLRHAVTTAAELYGILRLMRRTQVGGLFAEGSAANQFLLPKNQNQRLLREGLYNQSEAINGELESVTKARRNAEFQQLYAQQKLATQSKAYTSGTLFGGPDQKEAASVQQHEAAARQVEATHTRITALEGAALEAEEREAVLLAQRQRVLEQQILLQRGISAGTIEQVYGSRVPGGPTDTAARSAAEKSAFNELALARSGGVALPAGDVKKLEKFTSEQRTLGTRFAAWSKQGGITGRVLGGVATTVERFPGGKLGSSIRGAASSMKRMASSIAGMLGPLDLLLIEAIVLTEELSSVQEKNDKVGAIADKVGGAAPDRNALREAIKRAAEARDEANNVSVTDALGTIGNTVFGFTGATSDPSQDQQQIADAAEADAQRLREGFRKARTNLTKGLAVRPDLEAYIDPGDVDDAIDAVVRRFNGGRIKVEKFNQDTNDLIKKINQSSNLTQKQQAELVSKIRLAQIDTRGPGTNYNDLAQLSVEDQQKLLEQYASIVSSGLASQNEIKAFTRVGVSQLARTLGTGGLENRVAAVTAIQTQTDAIKEAASAELQRSLLFAGTQEERDKAYDKYIAALDPSKSDRAIKAQSSDAKDRLRRAQDRAKELRSELAESTPLPPGVAGPPSPILQGPERDQITKRLEAARQEQKGIEKELEGLQKTARLRREKLRQLQEEAKQERFDSRTNYLDALHGLREARLPEGPQRLAQQLKDVNQMIDRARRTDQDPAVILQLLTDRQGLYASIAQDQSDLTQARGEYRTAGIDPDRTVAIAQSQLETAQQVLAQLQGAKGTSQTDLINAATEVRNAEQAVADAIEERADAIAEARFELARAQAIDNEVAQAQIDLREQRRALRTADTKAERITARAGILTSRHDLIEARANTEIEDVQYAADIGKLSLSAQIREYTKILNTMKLTKDLRRDLRSKIYQLRQDLEGEAGGFDLAVGDIRLPSIYDIRRAVQGGINQAPQVNLAASTEINVNGSGDPERVATLVAAKQGTAAQRNANALRSAGYGG